MQLANWITLVVPEQNRTGTYIAVVTIMRGAHMIARGKHVVVWSGDD